LGFGLELVNDRCGELPVKPLSSEGTDFSGDPPAERVPIELGFLNRGRSYMPYTLGVFP
jgi:hypothetical protein